MSDKRYTGEFKSEADKQVLNMGDLLRKSLPGWGSAPIHCTLMLREQRISIPPIPRVAVRRSLTLNIS